MPKPGEHWTLAQAIVWISCALDSFASDQQRDSIIARCEAQVGLDEKGPAHAYLLFLHSESFRSNGMETIIDSNYGNLIVNSNNYRLSMAWSNAHIELQDDIQRGQIQVMGCLTANCGPLAELSKLECAGLKFGEDGEKVCAKGPADLNWRWWSIRLDAAQIVSRWPSELPQKIVSDARGIGGRPPAADWSAIEEALEREIRIVGFPRREGFPGWRYQADVQRWVEAHCGNDEPGKTAVKENTKAMLGRIEKRIAGK